MKYIDLHIHSNHSDGILSLNKIIEYAKTINLCAISITDHDCVDAYHDLKKLIWDKSIEIIPGIEISTYEKRSIHILGYYIDCHNSCLNLYTKDVNEVNRKKLIYILRRLREKDIVISLNEIRKIYQHISVNKIKEYLIKNENVEKYKYIYDLCIENELKRRGDTISPKEAIELIHQAGGISILAHPYYSFHDQEKLEDFVKIYKMYGLDGIECIHPKHNYIQMQQSMFLAHKYNLLITGGSDYHGNNSGEKTLGVVNGFGKIDYSYLAALKNYKI